MWDRALKCASHATSVRVGNPVYNKDHNCHDTDLFTLLLPSLLLPPSLSLSPLSWYALPLSVMPLSLLSDSCMDTMCSTVLSEGQHYCSHAICPEHRYPPLPPPTFYFFPFLHLSSLFNFLLFFKDRAGKLLVIFKLFTITGCLTNSQFYSDKES